MAENPAGRNHVAASLFAFGPSLVRIEGGFFSRLPLLIGSARAWHCLPWNLLQISEKKRQPGRESHEPIVFAKI
jgi:hypothetical protein